MKDCELPSSTNTIRVVKIDGRTCDTYAVVWTDKTGEERSFCKRWNFIEDAQKKADQLRQKVIGVIPITQEEVNNFRTFHEDDLKGE